jgi:hypothetical protein
MHTASKALRGFQSPLHERLVDDHFGSDVLPMSLPASVGSVGGAHRGGGNVAYTDVENLESLVSVPKHGVVRPRYGCGLSV